MEASSIISGPKTLPNVHNVPLGLRTNISLFPKRLLQNQALSSKKPSKHELICVKAGSSDGLESTRPLTYFSPTFWGDHFLSIPVDDSEFEALEQEIDSVMKPKVRDMLMSLHNSNKERLCLIHLLISLGVAHYFESDIEEILYQAFENLTTLISKEDDLETSAIMFEVFRLYGHKVSCDVFDRFKGKDGKLNQIIAKDVRGMLQLYEAVHLGTSCEDILDEARSFTRYHLESLTDQETSTNLFKHIHNELYRARYHNIEIRVAQQYISFYEQEQGHDETLLKFAKLNFNFCQMHYVKELKILTKWWKKLGMASKLPYIRDRNVEIYLGQLGMFFEPRYSLERVICTKLVMLMTILDDTFDAYATLPEVISLVDAFQRWDLSAIEELPSYMRIIFRTVIENVEDIDQEMNARGKYGTVQLTIDEMKSLMIAYLGIAKWAHTGHVPSFHEYMEVGLVSAALDDVQAHAFIAMDDCDDMQFKEWFNSKPKIIKALNAVFRIRNDIVTYEQEMSRGEVANGVNCYMKQYDVSKEVAVEELTKMERNSYKMLVEEFMTTKAVPRQVLVRVFNSARVIDVYYKEGDAFGKPDLKLQELLASLFLCPFSL